VIRRAAAFALLTAAGAADAVAGQATALPVPLPPPTVYSAPTPAPMAPPINPGPAVVPPAGLSPLLSEPGPIYPMPAPTVPHYPPAPTPGPIDQQKAQSYRNDLLNQRWQLERSGDGLVSRRSREIQQQLDAPDSR
jgi:hypothetical protein